MGKDNAEFPSEDAGVLDPAKLAAEGDLLADEVRDALLAGLRERVEELFVKAGETAGVEAGSGGQDFRTAMRLLLDHRETVLEGFLHQLAQRFDPDAEQRAMSATIAISFDELSLQKPESLEENIATTNVGNRGELIYEHQLWELRQRMEWWRDDPSPRVSDKSLAPYAICRAFFDGLRPLDLDIEVMMLIFWQFDRYVMRKLHDVYDELIELFDRREFYPLAMIAKMAESRQAVQRREATALSVDPPPALRDQAGVDPQTWRTITELAAQLPKSQGDGKETDYGDGNLANDLAALLSGKSVPGWNAQPEDLGSRASAVGRAFNRIVTDPHLARPIQSQFDSLRFAVLKTSLSDPSFFRDPKHPVRGLVNELAELAASSRLHGSEELDRMSHLLGEIHRQFELRAEDVKGAAGEQEPVSAAEIERFLDDQIQQQRRRRDALIEKSRRVVDEELWLQTAARHVPDSMHKLLANSWAPMMALRLLRYGVSSKLWRQGVQMLMRIVDAVDPPMGAVITENERGQLIEDFADQLAGVGMVPQRVAGLRQDFERSLAESDVLGGGRRAAESREPAEVPLGDREEWLELLMRPGTWYEVFDRGADAVRWMLAQGRKDGTLSFSEYGGKNPLHFVEAEFIEDLRKGVSAPVNPSPRARAALQRLLQVGSKP